MCVCVCVCMCVYMCVCEREKEGERESVREREPVSESVSEWMDDGVSVVPVTHSTSQVNLPPSLALSITTSQPPTRRVPRMMTVRKPARITSVWKASVHTTALMPPW